MPRPWRWDRHRCAWHLLLLGAVFLVGLGIMAQRSMTQTKLAADWVLHTQGVLGALGDLREALARMESAQRGHLLTQGRSFAGARDAAVADLHAAVEHLAGLTPDNPTQQARILELGSQVSARVALALAQSPADMDRIAQDLQLARAASAAIYSITSEMEREELRLLAERQQAHGEHLRGDLYAVAALVLGSVGVLAFAYHQAWAQTARRLSAERLMSDLLGNMPVAAWQFRSAGKFRAFTYASPGAYQHRGVHAEDLLRDSSAAVSIILDEDRPRVEAAIAQAEHTLECFDVRYRVLSPAGDIRWIESRATVRRERDGACVWSGYWRDVTDDVRLEQELQHAHAELEAFSYSVSHDLRAPLLAAEALRRALARRTRDRLDPESRSHLDRMGEAMAQMHGLIEALLQMAGLARAELHNEQVDLSQTARDIVVALREREPARRCVIHVAPGLSASGDPRLLRQVLANLLDNAWKFTARQPEARIEVGAGPGGPGEAVYFVRDNGAGFEMANAGRLFGAFQRLHHASDFPGTGVGLATVKRILARHGGRVWAESSPGAGSTFYFALPDRLQ